MMTKFIVILGGVAALATSLGFAYLFLPPSPFGVMNPIGNAYAQETPAESAHEENKTNNVQNGFSPISPAVTGQVPKQPGNISNLNLLPQSLIKTGSPLLGSASAPITIVEFGDFQCEFCDRFAKDTEPTINATYIQTGKANMIFKNFVTHGPDSSLRQWEHCVLTIKVNFGISIRLYTKIKEQKTLVGLMRTI